MLTLEQKKEKVITFIEALTKIIDTEDNKKRELFNDRACLEMIDEMVDNGEPFPPDNPFKGFIEWRDQVHKEIAASEKALLNISESKIEREFYQYYIDTIS